MTTPLSREQAEEKLQIVFEGNPGCVAAIGAILAHDAALRQRVEELEKVQASEEAAYEETIDTHMATIADLQQQLAAVTKERDGYKVAYQREVDMTDAALVQQLTAARQALEDEQEERLKLQRIIDHTNKWGA